MNEIETSKSLQLLYVMLKAQIVAPVFDAQSYKTAAKELISCKRKSFHLIRTTIVHYN